MGGTGGSGGSRHFEKKWAEYILSVPSSFIANAHNELYAVYTGKGGLLQKNSEHIGERGGAPPPLNPPLTGGKRRRGKTRGRKRRVREGTYPQYYRTQIRLFIV